MNIAQHITRNIAKSGEVFNWGGFIPFRLHLGLIVYRSQSASCHIAKRYMQAKILVTKSNVMKKDNATFKLLFIIVLLGFTACNREQKPPSFYSLGITSDSVIEKFEG